jgi:hypothetical protein
MSKELIKTFVARWERTQSQNEFIAHQNKIEWRLTFNNISRPRLYTAPNGDWDALLKHARNSHTYEFPRQGQSMEHWHTLAFIIANWSVIGRVLNRPSSAVYSLSCFPEVGFPDPEYPYKGFSVDVVGVDPAGIIRVIEIGSQNKTSQLQGYIGKLERTYPHAPIFGLLAYYHFNRRHTHATVRLVGI